MKQGISIHGSGFKVPSTDCRRSFTSRWPGYKVLMGIPSCMKFCLAGESLSGVQKAEVRRSEHCTSAPPLLPDALTGTLGPRTSYKDTANHYYGGCRNRPRHEGQTGQRDSTAGAEKPKHGRGQRAGVNGIRKPTRDQPDSRARQTASPRARSQ